MRYGGKATRGKGKTWKRGQSSSSNPETRKYRNQVNILGSLSSTGNSSDGNKLTESALSTHNILRLEKLGINSDENEDGMSDVETVRSFASVWSDCTNVSFNKLFNNWQASSTLHKEMLAILAMATELIKSKGGKETESEYFTILITTLQSSETEEAVTATVLLLKMVLMRLPPSVIKFKFSETSRILVEFLMKYIDSENGYLLRGLIGCLSFVLRAQELALWQLSDTQQVFKVLLNFTTHPKPRIRKIAQNSIVGILKGSSIMTASNPPDYHPVAPIASEFCIKSIEETKINDNISSALHLINLLEKILHVLPSHNTKKCCETMLKLMTLKNVLVVSSCFKAFHHFFYSKPSKITLTPEMNSQLILALYSFQPNLTDTQPLCAWLSVIKEALVCLHSLDEKLSSTFVMKMITEISSCWIADSKDVHASVADSLKDILTNCVNPSLSLFSSSTLDSMLQLFENCLGYQYSNSWNYVLSVIACCFTKLGKNQHKSFQRCLKTLADLRETHMFPYDNELDYAVGCACKSLGPEAIVEAIPLNFEENASKTWVIPIIRDFVENSKLYTFITYFLPLIQKCEAKLTLLQEENLIGDVKAYSILINQLWSLLPSFSNSATDLDSTFKKLAPKIGAILKENEDLRYHALTVLKTLLKKDDPSTTSVMANYSINYLPILFNLYIKSDIPDEKRANIYETFGLYLKIADKDLIDKYYTEISQKLENLTTQLKTDGDKSSLKNCLFLKKAYLDILRALVPVLTSSGSIKSLFCLLESLIYREKLIEKKICRIIEEICRSENLPCKTFINENLDQVYNLLFQKFNDCSQSTLSAVFRAFQSLIERKLLSSGAEGEIENILSKIMNKTVDSIPIKSIRVRTSALDLLVTMCSAFDYINKNSGLNVITEKLINIFNSSSAHTKQGVILGLEKLFVVHSTEFINEKKKKLIDFIVLQLSSKLRPVVSCAIEFIKAFFRNTTPDQLLPYCELIIIGLTTMDPSNKKHFRFKVKEILTRFIRKFGFATISKIVPESFSKVMRSIRKLELKKKKGKKNVDSSTEFSDKSISRYTKAECIQDILMTSSDEESEDDQSNFKPSWILEDVSTENGVLNLLDSSSNRNILSKNPFLTKQEKKTKSGFEISEDGKIIIEDLEKTQQKVDGKRKIDEDENQEDIATVDCDEKNEEPPKYKHGGKGIHRPFKRRKQTEAQLGEVYKSNKAGGDVKKKGLPDPYAYIPLNKQVLNKRKKIKFKNQFNDIAKRKKSNISKKSKSK